MSNTVEVLTKKYGVLLSLEQCADLFDRSTEGLRVSLCRRTDLVSQQINGAKVKFGRRVMFRASDIAKIIDEA